MPHFHDNDDDDDDEDGDGGCVGGNITEEAMIKSADKVN